MRHHAIFRVLGKTVSIVALFLIVFYIEGRIPYSYVNINRYVTSDVVYADGHTAHFDDKNFGRVGLGDVVTVEIALPQERIFDSAILPFYDFNTTTEVWCGETLLASYGENLAQKGMMIGNRFFQISIPDAAWGGKITIILHPTEKSAFTGLATFRLYPAAKAYLYFIEGDPLAFVSSITLFILGLVGIAACFLSMSRGATLGSGLCLSSMMLLISCWMGSNMGIYTMFGLDSYIFQPLEYIAGYTIAIPTLLFFRCMCEEKSKWKRVFSVNAILDAAFFAVATVLNFTNIIHYDAMMMAGTVFTLISCVHIFIYIIHERKDHGKTQSMMRTGIFIFLPTCLYELFVRDLFRYIPIAYVYNIPPLLSLGVLLFFACLTSAFFSKMNDSQRKLLTIQVKAETMAAIFEATPAGICCLNPNERLSIVAANELFYQIVGYPEEELGKDRPKDLFSHLLDSEKEFINEKLAKVLKSDTNAGEFELSTVDTKDMPLTVLMRYYYDRAGSGYITVNVIDITDRKRMEENLRISEERYKLALSQSGRMFFFLDVDTRTLHLSQKLSTIYNLPAEMEHMPDDFIERGLVEKDSIDSYKKLHERIFSGEPSGETIVACYLKKNQKLPQWYKLSYTSVFDDNHQPTSAIITYDDISEQYKAELSSRWRQLNLISIPEEKYVIAVYDLTRNQLLSQTGKMFEKMPDFVSEYDEIGEYVIEHFIDVLDRDACTRFFDRQRLLAMYDGGKSEDTMEYRSLQAGSSYRWTSTAISMIKDPYNRHIMAQILFTDINDSKNDALQMEQSMQELQQELDNSRIKVMINQMQPHFLYNALSSIQMIIKRDPDRAYALIHDFTVHLRSSIKALSSDDPIPFEEELRNIKAYLNIEMMRFSDKLHVNYDIECTCFKVIPLTIEPLVENAVKHGIFPKGKAGGTVSIRTYEAETAYAVVVEDDGAGFDINAALEKGNNSYGLKNLVFRLKSMPSADVVFKSAPDCGTTITVFIPKQPEELVEPPQA